jgi:hypothetical protein
VAECFLAAERLRGQGKRIAVAVPGMPALPEDRLLSVEPRGSAFVYRLRKVAGQEMRDFPSLDALVKAIETGEA